MAKVSSAFDIGSHRGRKCIVMKNNDIDCLRLLPDTAMTISPAPVHDDDLPEGRGECCVARKASIAAPLPPASVFVEAYWCTHRRRARAEVIEM